MLVLGAMLTLTFMLHHVPAAHAATYYVAVTGNNSNPGTEAQPWRTIQWAANRVQPGDRVLITPGVYTERVVMKTSGTSTAPIVFEGMRGPNGEWLSILDGSDPVTARWEPDPSLPQVYRAILPYEPYAMMLDGPQCASNPDDCSKIIWRIGFDAMYERQTFAPGQPDAGRRGWAALTTAANAEIVPYYTIQTPVRYWDGIEALFGYKSGYTYLRFRNGDNPNGKPLRISPGPSCQYCLPTVGAFTLDSAKYVTLSHMRVRGARNGVLLQRGAAFNTVERNHISGGQARVRLDTAAATNAIRFNVMRSNHISGWLPGARAESLVYAPYERIVNWNLYFVNKMTVGDGAEDDRGVFLFQSGAGNLIHDNEIWEGATGIALLEQADGTRVYRNIIRNMHSQGILMGQGIKEVQVYDNLIYDNAINLRIQELHYNNEEIYIYRNRFWNPFGQHVFLNSNSDATSKIYFYHNSFSSPFRTEIIGSKTTDRVTDFEVTTHLNQATNVVLLNNILGSMREGELQKLGLVASNLMPPGYVLPGNLAYQPKPWGDVLPDFKIAASSQARDIGLDLSKPFVVQGRSFAPLPGINAAADGKPDLGAYEYTAGGNLSNPSGSSPITAPPNLRRIP